MVRKVDLSTELQILAFHEQRQVASRLVASTVPARVVALDRRGRRRPGGRWRRERARRRAVVPDGARSACSSGPRSADGAARTLEARAVPCATTSPRPSSSSTCNRLEVYAEVSKFHGGVADVGQRARRCDRGARCPSSPTTSTCTTRAPRSTHLFSRGLRAGLDGGRRAADPRPGPRRRCAPAQESGAVGRPARRAAPARAAGRQAGAQPRPGSTAPARSLVEAGLDRGRGRRRPARGRQRARRRCRCDERARRRDPAPGTASAGSSSPTGRRRARAAARRGRRRHGGADGRAARGAGRRRRRRLLHRAPSGTSSPRRPPWPPSHAAAAAGRRSTSTSPCRATSTRRAADVPGVHRRRPRGPRPAPLATARARGRGRARRRSASSSPTRSPAYLAEQRAEAVAPTVVALRAHGPRGRRGRAGPAASRLRRRGRARSAPRSSRPCTGWSRSCCTPRPSGSRSWPGSPAASAYAEALRELFDLDLGRVAAVTDGTGPSVAASAVPSSRARLSLSPARAGGGAR